MQSGLKLAGYQGQTMADRLKQLTPAQLTNIQDVWEALPPRKFPNYAAGTWGPKEADELLEHDKRHWSTTE